jgi:RimJ/RimL family protein N-acetyltransferase
MTAVRPLPRMIEGRFISLQPLTRDLLPELFAAIAHPVVYAGGFGGGPAAYRDTLDGFARWAERYFAWDVSNVYAIKLRGGEHDGLLIGTSTLGDFDLGLEYAHLGWTAYDPRVWGTAVNAEAKLLILTEAFASGIGRVKIQADVLNLRSRAAIAKLGATFEGISRRDIPRADGSWRDSAIFAVTIDDWPAVRDGLRERLAVSGAGPIRLNEL